MQSLELETLNINEIIRKLDTTNNKIIKVDNIDSSYLENVERD